MILDWIKYLRYNYYGGNMRKNKYLKIGVSIIALFIAGTYYINDNYLKKEDVPTYEIESIPSYEGKNYIILNDNEPDFSLDDYSNESFENYQDLDNLGRATGAFANIGKDLMPTEKRESIGMIKPSGWHTVKYDFIDGKYLYNRCHLIAYQLTGENANEKNLITCTRQMNTEGMIEFENMVADYIKKTNNHVLYRVTPVYENDNLLAKGVVMEAESLEDGGKEIKFKIFVYNIQTGVEIDYKTGNSKEK